MCKVDKVEVDRSTTIVDGTPLLNNDAISTSDAEKCIRSAFGRSLTMTSGAVLAKAVQVTNKSVILVMRNWRAIRRVVIDSMMIAQVENLLDPIAVRSALRANASKIADLTNAFEASFLDAHVEEQALRNPMCNAIVKEARALADTLKQVSQDSEAARIVEAFAETYAFATSTVLSTIIEESK